MRNSFARRWNLAQVANALKPAPPVTPAVAPAPPAPAPPAPTPPTPVPPTPVPPTPVPAAPVRAATPAPVEAPASAEPEPVAPKVPEKTTRPVYRPSVPVIDKPRAFEIEEEEPVVAKRIPVARYVGLAVVVLAIITWLVLRPGSTPAPQRAERLPKPKLLRLYQAAPPASSATPAPSPAAKKPSAAVPPRVAAPVDRPFTGAATGRSVWRVIAYAYKRQEDATAMVARISGKHPNLKVEVFNPPAGVVYLISLGGADMDHERRKRCSIKHAAWVYRTTRIFRTSRSEWGGKQQVLPLRRVFFVLVPQPNGCPISPDFLLSLLGSGSLSPFLVERRARGLV